MKLATNQLLSQNFTQNVAVTMLTHAAEMTVTGCTTTFP